MKGLKFSLANAEGKLSKSEMKEIMAGSVIHCYCDYGSFTLYGSCSGPTIAACNSYACSGGGVNLQQCN